MYTLVCCATSEANACAVSLALLYFACSFSLALIFSFSFSFSLFLSLFPSRSRPRSLSLPICMLTASRRFSMNDDEDIDNTIALQCISSCLHSFFFTLPLPSRRSSRSNAFLFPFPSLYPHHHRSFACALAFYRQSKAWMSLFQVVCVCLAISFSSFSMCAHTHTHSSIDRLDDVR